MKNNYDMPMALAIITGFLISFPYAWFYQTKSFAIMAGVISIGFAYIGYLDYSHGGHFIGAWVTICLWILAAWQKAEQDSSKALSLNHQVLQDGESC